jgi:hypothetical protein
MPLDEAKALLTSDPLVRDGYITLDAHMWYVADESLPKP